MPLRLNLGAADRRIPGFLSVDIAPPSDVIADLSRRWPWDDNTVDDVFAADIFEHLPDQIHTWNELHRVMKPGAKAVIEVPNAAKGAGFFQDPTHRSPYCMNSFQYIRKGSFAHTRLAKSYGLSASFDVLELKEHEYKDEYEPVFKIVAVLRK